MTIAELCAGLRASPLFYQHPKLAMPRSREFVCLVRRLVARSEGSLARRRRRSRRQRHRRETAAA